MRAVVSPVLLRPAAIASSYPPRVAAEPISIPSPTASLQSFCRLQVEQILPQLPDVGIRLVYQPLEQSERQSFAYGREWSMLDAETQADLAEAWWVKNSVGCLKRVMIGSRRFYVCSISSSKPEYLLIDSARLLTETQKRLIENAAQLLSNHLAIARELNVQRQAQHQLEQKNDQIEHQVKSPIALIQIYTKILLSTASEERSHLESIQASIQEISRHIKQLTTKSKPLRIEQHDLSKILTQSLNPLQLWLTQKQITVEYSRSPILLDVDAWQLKQVFDNLITNAIYFSPNSGTIRCTWRVTQQEVLVAVSDQGSGLSETDLERVFTPFYSRRPEGTGLGLSIAQNIIQAHHGRIWVNNNPTGGATFSFTLPRQHPKLSIVPTIAAPVLTSPL